MKKLKIIPSNLYLIEINILIARLPIEKYVQWASYGPKGRFFIKKGSTGVKSISSKNATVLAQSIVYLNH